MAYGYRTNSPFGLKPSRGWDGTTNPYYIASGYATSLFKGDPIVPLNDGTVGIASVGGAMLGVFWGCKYVNSSGTLVHSDYWPASTVVYNAANSNGATAYIIDDPNVLFDIQVSSTTNGGTLYAAYTNLNNNANFALDATNKYNSNPGTGSTVTGLSGYFIDQSTMGAGNATYTLKIMQLTPFINNAFDVNYNNVIVQINDHVLKGGTGTAGI
jgi:hypothetical protein